MPETQDNPHLDKAQQDKERFLASKKGLLPEFEFPQDETKPDKEYSKETLWADTIEERLESVKELMQNPELVDNAIEDLKDDADSGSQGDESRAAIAFKTYSDLLESKVLTPEQKEELEPIMHNPELLTNVIGYFKQRSDSGKRGILSNAAWTIQTYSALLKIEALAPEQITELKETMHNPDLLNTAIKDLKFDADEGSQGNEESANSTFLTYSGLLETEALTPKQITELKETMHNPDLLNTAIENLKSYAESGQQGFETNAAYAFHTYSALLNIQQHSRQEGKSIDEAKSAEQELNPDKNIPPRPEMRSY